jgi:hypothetical protein
VHGLQRTERRVGGAAVMAACLAAVWVSGCSGGGQTCGVADYVSAGQSDFATPRQALQSVLAAHPQGLSTHGWTVTEHTRHGVTFRSGNDIVDVTPAPGGGWDIGAVTTCIPN